MGQERMILNATLCLAAATACVGVAAFVLLREKRRFVSVSLVGALILLALESFFAGLTCSAVLPEDMLHWQRFRSLFMALVPGTWLLFSLSYARGNYRDFLRKWRIPIAAAFLVPTTVVVISWSTLFEGVLPLEDSETRVILHNRPATLIHVVFILLAVMTLLNLEKTLRAAQGTMRWRIKFMVIGAGTLFAVRIYSSTQALLYSSLDLTLEGLNAGALLICQALILRSLLRARLLGVDLYPSQRVLSHSFTVVLAGVYLLAIGIMAHLATHFGMARGFPVNAFLLFVALIGVSLLAVSDRVRQTARRFVSRHFRRPVYDYRRVWTEFANHTASVMDAATLMEPCSFSRDWMPLTL